MSEEILKRHLAAIEAAEKMREKTSALSKDEIVRLALEAGFGSNDGTGLDFDNPENLVYCGEYPVTDRVMKFAELLQKAIGSK